MATTVDTRCGDCERVVRVPATAVSLIRSGETTTYGFQCPQCGSHTVKPADDETIELLRAAGLRPTVFVPPQRQPADPLTEDDLIALGLALKTTSDPLAELLP